MRRSLMTGALCGVLACAAMTTACGPDEQQNNQNNSAPANRAPTAQLSASQTKGFIDERIVIDGSMSADEDGDALTYAWTLKTPDGSESELTVSSDGQEADFKPDVGGDYIVSLVVSDGTLESEPATLTIAIEGNIDPTNRAPVADAGADQSVNLGERVTLDGSGSSDPDEGDTLNYQWRITTDPSGGVDQLIDGDDNVIFSFTPALEGEYEVTLTVTDGDLQVTDTVLITVTDSSTENRAPVANAGLDAMVDTGEDVTLDGSGSSDADGDDLSYLWEVTGKPEDDATYVLSGETTATPTFNAATTGDYTLTLTVTDPSGLSSSDEITVSVSDQVDNAEPTALAGDAQTVTVGEVVMLDGSLSSDKEDDTSDTPLTYSWSFATDPSNGADTIMDADTATPSFTPSVEGTYLLTLTVTDSEGASDEDGVAITVVGGAMGDAPVANAGDDRYVVLGSTIPLDGSLSTDVDDDAAGVPLGYAWSVTVDPSNGADLITDQDMVASSFTPSMLGTYEITLDVTDSDAMTSSTTIVLTVIEAPEVILSEIIEGSSNNKALGDLQPHRHAPTDRRGQRRHARQRQRRQRRVLLADGGHEPRRRRRVHALSSEPRSARHPRHV